MTRKLNIVLLALLIFVGAPFYLLMLDASGGGLARPVTIEELRRLAMERAGSSPIQARYETIGRRMMIGDLLAAGSGLRPVPLMIRAFQLVWTDGATITIDRGMSRAVAQSQRIADFDPTAQAVVDRSLAVAALTLVLAPGVHHSGRMSTNPSPSWPAKVTKRERPYAVAPGVVVIPTSDIAAGERMIYVRLANGRELLWAGDIAAVHASWQQLRPPARLVTTYAVDRNRDAIAGWLRTVRALKSQAPELQVVAGHDAQLSTLLVKGFAHRVVPGGARSR